MCCTFGDLTDVIWWRELQLNMRAIISRDGRLIAEVPHGLTDETGIAHYNALAGKSAKQAQTAIADMLASSGEMVGEPRPITHPVKFYEKGRLKSSRAASGTSAMVDAMSNYATHFLHAARVLRGTQTTCVTVTRTGWKDSMEIG
jgi:precorrin-6x reductase